MLFDDFVRETREWWMHYLAWVFQHQEKCYKRYAWEPRPKRVTESAARTDLEKHGPVPCTSLVSVAAWFLIDSAENQKVSEWISNMRYTLDRLILPFFGEHKNVGEYHAPERRGVC